MSTRSANGLWCMNKQAQQASTVAAELPNPTWPVLSLTCIAFITKVYLLPQDGLHKHVLQLCLTVQHSGGACAYKHMARDFNMA